ncbi:TonB-dependent receptor plug domain-containing protein [Novosphingobium album (ex Liu et al. 2023)]|uniref:TonB-dependent receptor n=1 Tax=Novosphingobium album (ex Liu et al. 2023) TaxID=3031130 RepID=A0ABT5WKG9_9SPHN|nr:TonB-dependent receptor [Novosphingobium album (ex Liu et al. 2023)]MDE8650201.1 TonB-dependent receptor [Novosphingobium album (ex Liu et al. 2023)]
MSASALSTFVIANVAAAAEPEAPADDTPGKEIVVTGTHVIRDGYEAPTPTTVVTVEQFQQQTSSQVIDFLTTLPAFSGNVTPSNSTESIDNGTAGVSSVNLRNLGATRTLVLIDGQRAAPSTIDGRVDIGSIPQQLIQRIDVVTGGASAAYGSDAVAGVVNFVLDTRYTGIGGEFSGGITNYGENANYNASLTAGTAFAGGRGHVIVSGQASHQEGIPIVDRPWNAHGRVFLTNPAYGTGPGQSRDVPQRLLLDEVGPARASRGGIIVSGPLKGIAFGEGGTPYQYNYGDLVSGDLMQGGEWREQNYNLTDGKSLEPKMSMRNLFARLSYDLTDSIHVFGQWAWSDNRYSSRAYGYQDNGGITVPVTNAFLDETIRDLAIANDLTTLTMGSSNQDMGFVHTDNKRVSNRFVFGLNGDFDALGANWTWSAYYQKGITRNTERSINNRVEDKFAQALDSVRDPGTGAIICRSTLTNPNDGCVAYNPFGVNVNSPTQLDYILDDGYRFQKFTQDVVAGSLQGEPFSTWAGPVSIAAGVEHRAEKSTGHSSDLDLQRAFYAGNYQPTIGEFKVTEGFLETVVPLARGTRFLESLDLNAAVRATQYSDAGYVTTWKAGLTWTPISDLTIRVSRSRDIRAPNISEVFNAGTSSLGTVVDSAPGPNFGATVQVTGINRGNPDLTPEKADTTGIGVVFRPSFFRGFQASVDYWNIDIKNVIANISTQQIVDLCVQGNADLCAAINPGTSDVGHLIAGSLHNVINRQPFNLARQNARGIDFEVSYATAVPSVFSSSGATLRVRGLASHYIRNYFESGVSVPTDSAGENAGNGPPSWRWQASATYDAEPLSLTLAARGISAGKYNNAWIECETGCPVSVSPNITVNNNHIPGAIYFDFSASYALLASEDGRRSAEVFLNIKNITNKDPAIVGLSGVYLEDWQTNPTLYDAEGRVFRLGVRFHL